MDRGTPESGREIKPCATGQNEVGQFEGHGDVVNTTNYVYFGVFRSRSASCGSSIYMITAGHSWKLGRMAPLLANNTQPES